VTYHNLSKLPTEVVSDIFKMPMKILDQEFFKIAYPLNLDQMVLYSKEKKINESEENDEDLTKYIKNSNFDKLLLDTNNLIKGSSDL
jgi:hypothetical protein